MCTSDKIHYLEKEWRSIPLCSSDLISSKETKTKHEILTRELLTEILIRESKFTNNNSFELFDIPSDFITLVTTDIINCISESNEEVELKISNSSSITDKDKLIWISFGRWLGMEEPIKRREVRRHLKQKWKRLQHALVLRNDVDLQVISNMITTHITRREKNRLIMNACDLKSPKGLVGFRYIINPECVVDMNNQTLIHLEFLDNLDAVVKATQAINLYYFYTLEYPSHRSESFWKNFIEHFGVFALNNLLPYTSSNSASSHNIEHLECVNNLIQGLEQLSNSVNRFLQKYYESLYKNLNKLNWGPFAPRQFGVFPMAVINFNTISNYHWDEHDDPNSFCCLVALGEFEGGELCFPQLKIVIPLRPNQVIAFSSRLLLHGNFPVTKGIRHSVVYFVHSMFFHHLRDFTQVYDDLENGLERDACGLIVSSIPRQDLNDAQGRNHLMSLNKPQGSQIQVPPASTNCRRGHIGKALS